jgi:hypothetical protein
MSRYWSNGRTTSRKFARKAFSHVLVVLAPLRREPEVRLRIAEQGLADAAAFLSWEDFLGALAHEAQRHPSIGFSSAKLNDYAEAQIGSKWKSGGCYRICVAIGRRAVARSIASS